MIFWALLHLTMFFRGFGVIGIGFPSFTICAPKFLKFSFDFYLWERSFDLFTPLFAKGMWYIGLGGILYEGIPWGLGGILAFGREMSSFLVGLQLLMGGISASSLFLCTAILGESPK